MKKLNGISLLALAAMLLLVACQSMGARTDGPPVIKNVRLNVPEAN